MTAASEGLPGVAPLPRTTATRRTITGFIAATVLLAAVQLLVGASGQSVLLITLATVAAMLPVAVYGVGHMVGIWFLALAALFALSALAAKTVLLEPIDSQLFNPDLTFSILAASMAALAVGALAVAPVARRLPQIVGPLTDMDVLRNLAIISLGFATLGQLMIAGGVLGPVAGFLVKLSTLSVVAATAYTVRKSDGEQRISTLLVIVVAFIMLQTMVNNSKAGFMLAGLAYIATLLAFGRAPRRWHVIGGAVALAFLDRYVFTAIHIVRGARTTLGPFDLLAETLSVSVGLIMGDADATAALARMEYYGYLRETGLANPDWLRMTYLGVDFTTLDRFVLIQFIDSYARRLSADGPFLGIGYLAREFWDFLPTPLNPTKSLTSSGAYVAWQLGLRKYGLEGWPTLTVFAESFAALGYAGIALICLYVGAAVSLAVSVIAGRLKENIFAVYMVTIYTFQLCVQNFDEFQFFLFRALPTETVLFLALAWLARRSAIGTGTTLKPATDRPSR